MYKDLLDVQIRMISQCDSKYGMLCACYTVITLFNAVLGVLYRNRTLYLCEIKEDELSRMFYAIKAVVFITGYQWRNYGGGGMGGARAPI